MAEKYSLVKSGPLNMVLARACILKQPVIVMPQQASFAVKTVYRIPIPLIGRLFGRVQIYQLITQLVVYPPLEDGSPDIDRAIVTMMIIRQKGSSLLKMAMRSDWDEAWDGLERMQRMNPKVFKIEGARDSPPWE